MSSSSAFSVSNELRSGSFERKDSEFRDVVTADGSSGFEAAPGRYHLYVAKACPWASRTLIVRALKGLEDVVDVSYAHPFRDDRGWAFGGGEFTDALHGWEFLAQGYEATQPGFDARVTVPVLWDTQTGRIVNNESAEIIRMLNSEFDAWGDASVDLYPEALREEIDAVNARVYDTLNNGVYKAGFAGSQDAYREAFIGVFETLDWLDARLGERRYLTGDAITEADWRLFVTLVRFDAVYVGHFKCNLRRIADYAHLSGYLRELYQLPKISETVDIAQIKLHYYGTHPQINPSGIVPEGPELDLDAPHGRG